MAKRGGPSARKLRALEARYKRSHAEYTNKRSRAARVDELLRETQAAGYADRPGRTPPAPDDGGDRP